MSLRRLGFAELFGCALATALCAAVLWLAFSVGPGGYTDHLRVVLAAQSLIAVMLWGLIAWVAIISTAQHREIRRIAIRAANRASQRASDALQGQIVAAATGIGGAAHELSGMLARQREILTLLTEIAAVLNVDVVEPVVPPGDPES